jgi:hypothetical protein
MSSSNQVNVNSSASFDGASFGDNAKVEAGKTTIIDSFKGGENPEELLSLVESLISRVQVFPPQYKVMSEVNLKHLKEEVQKPHDKRDVKNISCYLNGLVSTAGAVLMSLGIASGEVAKVVANVGDVMGGVRMVTEEVQRIKSNSSEFKALSSSDWEVVETVGVVSKEVGQNCRDFTNR